MKKKSLKLKTVKNKRAWHASVHLIKKKKQALISLSNGQDVVCFEQRIFHRLHTRIERREISFPGQAAIY